MPACELEPADKRAFIDAVGQKLVKRHGKKKYYKTGDIAQAATECGYPIDWACWAYCIFASPDAFRSLHEMTGEACDYAAMKADVLAALADGAFQLPNLELSWREWPDINLSQIFDWFDWSP